MALAAPVFAADTHDPHQGTPAAMSGASSDMTAGSANGMSSHIMVTPPASIMGAVMLQKGHFMVNFIPMWMSMDGLRMGTDKVSPEEVVTTVPNRFAGQPMPGYPMMKQPSYIRLVPESMDMSGQMLGLMYGLTDNVNLMVMATYLEKSMTMQTYAGGMGATLLGTSSASSQGFGDTSASVLVRLYEDSLQEAHLILGLSLPTGSITERDTMLSSSGIWMNMRLAYGMQLGDGTYDALPSLVYTGRKGRTTWGGIYRGRYPLETNDEGWRLGNWSQLTGWAGYDFMPRLTGTLRIAGTTADSIHGMDPQITGPSTGANPDFYGGDTIDALVGLSGKVAIPGIGKGRVAVEFGLPLYQRLNGVQAEQDWSLTFSFMGHF
jgi:hypothetical protein